MTHITIWFEIISSNFHRFCFSYTRKKADKWKTDSIQTVRMKRLLTSVVKSIEFHFNRCVCFISMLSLFRGFNLEYWMILLSSKLGMWKSKMIDFILNCSSIDLYRKIYGTNAKVIRHRRKKRARFVRGSHLACKGNAKIVLFHLWAPKKNIVIFNFDKVSQVEHEQSSKWMWTMFSIDFRANLFTLETSRNHTNGKHFRLYLHTPNIQANRCQTLSKSPGQNQI